MRRIGPGVRTVWVGFWLAVILAGNLWHGAGILGWLFWGLGAGMLLLGLWWRRQDGPRASADERLLGLLQTSRAKAFWVIFALLVLLVAGDGFGLPLRWALSVALLGGTAAFLGIFAYSRYYG